MFWAFALLCLNTIGTFPLFKEHYCLLLEGCRLSSRPVVLRTDWQTAGHFILCAAVNVACLVNFFHISTFRENVFNDLIEWNGKSYVAYGWSFRKFSFSFYNATRIWALNSKCLMWITQDDYNPIWALRIPINCLSKGCRFCRMILREAGSGARHSEAGRISGTLIDNDTNNVYAEAGILAG